MDAYFGVDFYGNGEVVNLGELKKCEIVFDDYDNWKSYTDINKVIELYNVKKYIDTGIRLEDWTNPQYTDYQNKANQVFGVVGCFLNSKDINELATLYNETNIMYRQDFVELVCKIGLYKKFDDLQFAEFLEKANIRIDRILREKDIIYKFGKVVREYILKDAENAEFFVNKFLERSEDKELYYIPKELTVEDKEGLVQRYIELDSPNMNYLTVIMQEENPEKLKLSEMTRFKAYKKLEIMRKKLFETGLSFRTGVGIGFKLMDGTGKIENESEDQNELKVSYDSKWILDNLDYATLLNNFYWFEFADFFNRCLLVSQPSEYGLENFLFGTRGLREYQVGTSFRIKNTMAFLQMTGYYNILCQREIEIEDIYKWFFETNLKDEFNVEGFVYEKVRRDAPFGERNRLISSKIDHVLKQFDLYSKYGAIDRDYLEFSSQSVEFSQVASLSTQKYAYCNDENIRSEYISIFSSQSLLTYVERIGKAYDSFFKLLENETVYYNDFKTIQKEKIDFLLSQGTIRIDEAGKIELKYDRLRMLIQLYRYEYLCLAYEKTENDPLKDALKNNKLLVENTLFSRPEQDYLDYLLNKHKFSNGLDLRNKYIHSTNSLDEKVHRDDYMRFLIVMAIIIIKINEEFCLKEKLKK